LGPIVGISSPTLSRFENCKIGNPETDHLLSICDWLGEPPESFYKGAPASVRARKHYLTYVNAGLPVPASDDFEYRDLSEEMMPDQDEYFTVTAKGDSMIGAQIYDGDLLIAKVSETANSGDIVIADIDGEYCVKIYDRRGDSITLRSANPEYDPRTIKEGALFRILGIVLHSIHRQRGRGPAMR
jgi:DNA polymerase V